MPSVDCRLKIAWDESAFGIRNSAIVNLPRSFRGTQLGLDSRLVNQHDRYVVFDSVDPVALRAFQTFRALAIFERLLASRTNQNLQKVFGNHVWNIVRQGGDGPCDGTHSTTERESRARNC